MTSEWKGYTILHDRNRAQGWKGEVDLSRPPEVDTTDLAQAMHIIDVLEGYEEACRRDVVVAI